MPHWQAKRTSGRGDHRPANVDFLEGHAEPVTDGNLAQCQAAHAYGERRKTCNRVLENAYDPDS
jgi:hypothetical protein